MERIDYQAQWRQAMNSKTVSGNPYRDRPEAAIAYDRSRNIWEDGFRRAREMDVEPGDTVLDIGSGPGVLAVPLAKRVRAVTAVEPSETMIRLMQAHAKEHGIDNLSAINRRWEDVSPEELGMFDHVIASYSLNMPELETALCKMNAVCRKRVTLYWFCGVATWEQIKMDLYPEVHGRQFSPQPKSDLIYGMLSNAGISAEVTPLEDTSFDRIYPDMDAAILNLRSRLNVSQDRWDDRFRRYIETHFQRLEGGAWRYVDRTHYVRISWKPSLNWVESV